MKKVSKGLDPRNVKQFLTTTLIPYNSINTDINKKLEIMFNDQEKTLKYLVSVEMLAEEILADRREIVMLDKRRNLNREALRDLTTTNQSKCWITVGSVLVKHNLSTTKTLLEDDQKQLNIDINKLRSDLKVKINKLRDLEMQPPVPGLMLVPMSQKESEGLASAGLF